MTATHPTREAIYFLLSKGTPLVASQIAWRLGITLDTASAHLGVLRRQGRVEKRTVYHPVDVVRIGFKEFKIAQTLWTVFERRHELMRRTYVELRTRKRITRRSHPITGDMTQMLEDMRYAASQ